MSTLSISYRHRDVSAEPFRWMRPARAVADWYRTRRAVSGLKALDDRLLRDIGLCRCGIDYAVRFGRD